MASTVVFTSLRRRGVQDDEEKERRRVQLSSDTMCSVMSYDEESDSYQQTCEIMNLRDENSVSVRNLLKGQSNKLAQRNRTNVFSCDLPQLSTDKITAVLVCSLLINPQTVIHSPELRRCFIAFLSIQ